MSKAEVKLVNVSSPSETVFIKELNVNILFNEELVITDDFTYTDITTANSLLLAIQNDKLLIKANGVLQSKADSISYVNSPYTGGGEANTASNVGTGAGVFKQKVGVDLEMRSISSSDFDVTEGADEIEIQADPALISNKSTVTAAAGMNALVEDSGNLRKVDVNDFLGGGSASFGFDKTKNAFYFPGTNRVDYAYRTNGTVSINQLNVIGFNIYGQVELESLSINATSALVANVVASIYKYDYATNNWNLVAQSTPYTTGISGLQTYTLPSTVTMENGLYFAGLLGDANAANLSGIQANGLFNAFGYATSPLNLAAVDKWYKYALTYTATMPATISGYPTGFIRQTSGNVGLPLLKFN